MKIVTKYQSFTRLLKLFCFYVWVNIENSKRAPWRVTFATSSHKKKHVVTLVHELNSLLTSMQSNKKIFFQEIIYLKNLKKHHNCFNFVIFSRENDEIIMSEDTIPR